MMSAENAALDFSHSGKVSRMRRQLVEKAEIYSRLFDRFLLES